MSHIKHARETPHPMKIDSTGDRLNHETSFIWCYSNMCIDLAPLPKMEYIQQLRSPINLQEFESYRRQYTLELVIYPQTYIKIKT